MKVILSLLALMSPLSLAAQGRVDTTGAGALMDQAMHRSEVMQNLEHLSDVIGPRLSGSLAMRRANDWTAERFKAYGLTAALEPYEFGVTWERGTTALRLLAPFTRAITGHSWAWTAGDSRQDADWSSCSGRRIHSRKPRGQQGQGKGGLGAPAGTIPDLEPGWAAHDGGGFGTPEGPD